MERFNFHSLAVNQTSYTNYIQSDDIYIPVVFDTIIPKKLVITDPPQDILTDFIPDGCIYMEIE